MINNVYWYICKAPSNMGDLISPYLFEKITGKKPKRCISNREPFILSCGSILSYSNSKAIVWGTGTMFRAKAVKPLKVLAVRGPITRQVLLSSGVSCPEVYGDPGLVLPRYYTPDPGGRHYRVGVIPHYSDHEYMSKTFSGIDGILVIDINRPVEAVCDDIKACDVTISSSLHGIIVSHAYDVPSAWMTASKFCKWPIGGGKLKYLDYYLSRKVNKVEPLPWNTLPTDVDELYKLIESFPQPVENVDIDKLISVCPFGKTKAEILNI